MWWQKGESKHFLPLITPDLGGGGGGRQSMKYIRFGIRSWSKVTQGRQCVTFNTPHGILTHVVAIRLRPVPSREASLLLTPLAGLVLFGVAAAALLLRGVRFSSG